MANNIIETFDLSKIYKLKGKDKSITALNNINISIKEGEIFGLLGPNGAGKTTMISILTTLLQPTKGYAIIDGYNVLKKPKKVKSRVSLMLDDQMLYFRLKGYDNLKFFCKLYKIRDYREKIYRIAKEFELENWLNQLVENYSSGMKMKLALCRTLLLERRILFLDEPTVGLDVKSVSFITKKLKDIDCTIFLTSHDMNVVEKLCNRIAFINKGNILKIGTKDDVKKLEQKEIEVEVEIEKDKEILKSELNQYGFISNVVDINNKLIISIKSRQDYKNLLLILGKYNVLKVKERELTLGDLFLKLI